MRIISVDMCHIYVYMRFEYASINYLRVSMPPPPLKLTHIKTYINDILLLHVDITYLAFRNICHHKFFFSNYMYLFT